MKGKKKTNPFDTGVTYDFFLKELGTQKIEDYLKGVCTSEQIKFVKNELLNLKKIKNGN